MGGKATSQSKNIHTLQELPPFMTPSLPVSVSLCFSICEMELVQLPGSLPHKATLRSVLRSLQ